MLVPLRVYRRGRVHQPQSIRDNEKIQKRIQANGDKLKFISVYLDKYFGTHVNTLILNSLAKIIMDIHGLELDRLAKRNRTALLCWYAENWDRIYPVLKHLNITDTLMNTNSNTQKIEFESFNPLPITPAHYADPFSLEILLNHH